jgi:hypothetical protein
LETNCSMPFSRSFNEIEVNDTKKPLHDLDS